MIRVKLAPEPTDFNARVRQPGLSAIAELMGEGQTTRRRGRKRKPLVINGVIVARCEDIPADAFPDHWTRALDDLLVAYGRVCAFTCFYIERVTGTATVDHMIPKSVAWDRVYEWSNYRLACALMNSRKGAARDVLDPFEVEDGWFRLELVGFQLVHAPELDDATRDRVKSTIARLQLNDPDCRALREAHVTDYHEGWITLDRLERRAPFIAQELRRQGRLRPEDT